jgi:vitamin B12 transporter
VRAEHDSPAGSVLAPSFGAIVSLGSNLRLAGNISESFGVPSLQDLYYPGAANPNLQPEKSRDRDVTLAYTAGRTGISLGWFGRAGSNFIVFDPVQFIPINEQRASTAGVSMTLRAPLFYGWLGELGYTDLYRALDLVTYARLPRAPVGQLTAGITKPFGPSRVAYAVHFTSVGSDGDDAANIPPPLTARYDAYTSLDAYLRYRAGPSSIVSLRGFNLTNDREAPIFGYPGVGRRFALEVSTR